MVLHTTTENLCIPLWFAYLKNRSSYWLKHLTGVSSEKLLQHKYFENSNCIIQFDTDTEFSSALVSLVAVTAASDVNGSYCLTKTIQGNVGTSFLGSEPAVEMPNYGWRLGTCSEPALQLPWWKRGTCLPSQQGLANGKETLAKNNT